MIVAAAFALTLTASPADFAHPAAAVVVSQAEMTPTLEDAPGLIDTLIKAVHDKNWQLVVAMAVMLLVVLVNLVFVRFGVLPDEHRKLVLPWVAAGSACLVVFASTLLAGGSWWSAGLTGFGTGAAAVGLWELVFKHLRKALKKKPPAEG